MAATTPKMDKETRILRNLLAAVGIFLGFLAILPFSWIHQLLTSGQSDGSFDSLSPVEYGVWVWIAAIIAVLCLISAALITIYQRTVSPFIKNSYEQVRAVSIRKDSRDLINEIKGNQEEYWFWGFVLIISGLAVFLRVLYITQPVGYDEAYTFLYFATRPLRYILTDYSAPNNHILHTILVSITYHLFGNHIWVLRLTAFIAGVLCIPMAYLVGKAFGQRWIGILAGLAIACSPMMISYSVNGRGYSLTVLFALTGFWLTGLLIQRSSFLKWLLLAVTCILGFYSIPIFLYPFGCFYLFLFFAFLYKGKNSPNRRSFFLGWLLSGLSVGVISLLLYVPVIVFGTGLSSIIGNEFVQSQGWNIFFLDLIARSRRVWSEWTDGTTPIIVWAGVLGLALKAVWDLKNIRKTFPFWLSSAIWLALILGIQRVTPWPRVWLFLLGFVLIWSADGWVSTIQWMSSKVKLSTSYNLFISRILVLVLISLTFIHYLQNMPEIEVSHEQQAAEFIQTIIQPDDTLVAVSPVPIQLGYYLSGLGIPYDRFYNRDRPHQIRRALVIFVDRSKFPSLDAVISWQRLEDQVDISQAELLYQHKRVNIYALPGK